MIDFIIKIRINIITEDNFIEQCFIVVYNVHDEKW